MGFATHSYWLVIKSVERVAREVLSVLASIMFQVRKAILYNNKRVYFEGSSL